MNANPIVGDEYSGLATLLANLIAKYADVLEFADDTEENQEPTALFTTANNRPIFNISQGSLTRASLLFSIANLQAA